MKQCFCITSIFFSLFVGFITLNVDAQTTGFHISGTKVLDSKDNEFIMRGINHAHTWYTSQLSTAIPAIAKTGANCVRIVLSNGKQWTKNNATDLKNVLKICKDNKLIAIPEIHDCTGFGDKDNNAPKAVSISTAADYWVEMKDALIGQEAYVIIDIANEPFGNGVSAATYTDAFKSAIKKLRDAGLNHLIMVDAGSWGQDWENLMKNNAAAIMDADAKKNIVFSVHMYEVYSTESIVDAYMKAFQTAGLPLVVGEFASSQGAGKNVAAQAVLTKAKSYGLGYIGWSWKGNGSGLEALDIVGNWDGSSPTTWGSLLLTGTDGIKTTSKLCSVFTTGINVAQTPAFNNIFNLKGSFSGTQLNIAFTAREPGNATVSISDLMGNVIDSQILHSLTAGTHATSFTHSVSASGSYLVKVSVGKRTAVTQVAVTR
jgi:mannan endo-1,4-beta-mannosidase